MRRWFFGLHRFIGKPAVLACFLLCALPVGLLSALLTPPGQVPDEPWHVARAAGLLHWALIGERRPTPNPLTGKIAPSVGIKVDTGLFFSSVAPFTMFDGHCGITAQNFLATRTQPPDHRPYLPEMPNTATYFPAAYLPATLAFALTLALKAPPYICFLAARIAMLGAFLSLGLLALWITAFGEALLLTVLLSPMTLFLAGSVNQDGVLIALSCLAGAALTRSTKKLRILGLLVFALLLGAKPPYILMFGAFLLPLSTPGFYRRLAQVAVACIPVILWVAVIILFIATPFQTGAYHPGGLYAGDHKIWFDSSNPGQNLSVLLHPATRLLTVPWRTITGVGAVMATQMISPLGLLYGCGVSFPTPYDYLWGFSGAVALLGLVFSRRPADYSPTLKIAHFCFLSLLISATIWLMLITFYIDYTPVGNNIAWGEQGRYFLPLLPFLLVAIPGWRWRFTLPPLLPALPTIALGLADIGYIPVKLVWYFYLH